MLLRRLDGIINCGRYGYGSGPLEGSNNAIKVLKRAANGFLDFNYFRLKILARLPGRGYARSTLLYGRLNRSWPSLKPVFSSVVFIQIKDEPENVLKIRGNIRILWDDG